MTIETERPTFRGVVCLHCKAPIPVPAIVSSLPATESEDTEVMLRKSQVFVVRCASCLKEKPYRTREILAFEGIPQTALFPGGPAPVRWFPQDGITRAAKA